MSTSLSGTPVANPVMSQLAVAGGTVCPKCLATNPMSRMSHLPSGHPFDPVRSPIIETTVHPSVELLSKVYISPGIGDAQTQIGVVAFFKRCGIPIKRDGH